MSARTFGKRAPKIPTGVRRPVSPVMAPLPAVRASEPQPQALPDELERIAKSIRREPLVDEELEAWTAQRRQKAFKIPWRSIYLMASLSFGFGGMVLPDS